MNLLYDPPLHVLPTALCLYIGIVLAVSLLHAFSPSHTIPCAGIWEPPPHNTYIPTSCVLYFANLSSVLLWLPYSGASSGAILCNLAGHGIAFYSRTGIAGGLLFIIKIGGLTMKKKIDNENGRTFWDFSNKSWIVGNDGQTINIAESALKLMKGEGSKIEVKEILHGDPWQT